MAIIKSTAQANVEADAGTTAYDGGVLQLRSGAPPINPDAQLSGSLIATIVLPATAFDDATSGTTPLSGSWTGTGSSAGTVGHFALLESGDDGSAGAGAGDQRIMGTVSEPGNGGDMILDNTDVAVDQNITISTFNYTVPTNE